ncbi:MAG: 4'-phosphopantetheinyl transferase superfamily protein [Gammaproteobacteria bacterium]|nr:4'-phosphopantetheinyl transferase superfamily protein [Gammaproteobacteria bacterium]
MSTVVCNKVNPVIQSSSEFVLDQHEVHIWYTSVIISVEQENILLSALSPDEVARANRFRFPIHRQRFIAARGMLRNIVGAYLEVDPKVIMFDYSPRGKPYLREQALQFNVSHSQDMAVYAFTLDQPIGVDIEKTQEKYDDAVAARFFSESEYRELSALPQSERALCFYRIWSRKEALIKVSGEGFAFALSSFTVPTIDSLETLAVNFQGESGWLLRSFVAHPEYQSAFATQQTIEKTLIREWK